MEVKCVEDICSGTAFFIEQATRGLHQLSYGCHFQTTYNLEPGEQNEKRATLSTHDISRYSVHIK